MGAVRRKLLAPEEDRPQLWALLDALRLGALFHAYCLDTGLDAHLSAAERRRLSDRFRSNAFRQAVLQRHAAEVTEELGAVGIPTLALKGAWLASRVYEAPGMRYMDDVDLLVPPERFDLACTRLLDLGFALHPYESLRGYAPHTVQLRRPEPLFGAREGYFDLDLHRRPVPPEDGGEWTQALWERRRPLPGRPGAAVPAPEAGLLLLAVHLLRHYLEPKYRCVAVADAAALVRRLGDEVDWEWLEETAAADPLVTVALRVFLEELGRPSLHPRLEALEARCAAQAQELGVDGTLERIRILGRRMPAVRSTDPSLASVGRARSATSALRLLLARLFSPDLSSPWKRQRLLRGTGGRLSAFTAWLRSLPRTNWRFALSSYLVARLQSRLAEQTTSSSTDSSSDTARSQE